jgi:hypothetical protein
MNPEALSALICDIAHELAGGPDTGALDDAMIRRSRSWP